jgi:hypothetical protein
MEAITTPKRRGLRGKEARRDVGAPRRVVTAPSVIQYAGSADKTLFKEPKAKPLFYSPDAKIVSLVGLDRALFSYAGQQWTRYSRSYVERTIAIG